jgi:short-subunit dehydrogenase
MYLFLYSLKLILRVNGNEQLEATGAKILEVDFVDESTILKAAQEYGSGPLDVLINCGGLYKILSWHLVIH